MATFFRLYEQQFAQLGKTWDETLRGQTTINTIEPLNLQAVLAKDFYSFGIPQNRSGAMRMLFGKSIINTEGAEWKHSRALIKPTFTKAELSDVTQFDTFVERFFELLPEGEAFDIQPLLHRLFLDVSTDFIFGTSIDALGAGKSEAEEFNKSFKRLCVSLVSDGNLAGLRYFLDGTRNGCRHVGTPIDSLISR